MHKTCDACGEDEKVKFQADRGFLDIDITVVKSILLLLDSIILVD